jgi:hypothetical protein
MNAIEFSFENQNGNKVTDSNTIKKIIDKLKTQIPFLKFKQMSGSRTHGAEEAAQAAQAAQYTESEEAAQGAEEESWGEEESFENFLSNKPIRVTFEKPKNRNTPDPLVITVGDTTYTGILLRDTSSIKGSTKVYNNFWRNREAAEAADKVKAVNSDQYYYNTIMGSNNPGGRDPNADSYYVEWENQDGSAFLYEYPVNDFQDPMLLNLDKKIEKDEKSRILMENDNGRQFYYDIYTNSVINYTDRKSKNLKIKKLQKRVNNLESRMDSGNSINPDNINNIKNKVIYPTLYGKGNDFSMSNNLENHNISENSLEQQYVEQQQVEEQLNTEEQQQAIEHITEEHPEEVEEEEEIQIFDPSKDNTTTEKLNGLSFWTKLLLTIVILILLSGIGYSIYFFLNRNPVNNRLLSNVRNNLRNNILR